MTVLRLNRLRWSEPVGRPNRNRLSRRSAGFCTFTFRSSTTPSSTLENQTHHRPSAAGFRPVCCSVGVCARKHAHFGTGWCPVHRQTLCPWIVLLPTSPVRTAQFRKRRNSSQSGRGFRRISDCERMPGWSRFDCYVAVEQARSSASQASASWQASRKEALSDSISAIWTDGSCAAQAVSRCSNWR
jgi:hypothetical protein